jgi:diguanylate cyclase (GGDEF)-like protein
MRTTAKVTSHEPASKALQVAIGVKDSFLESVYKKRLAGSSHCLVWCESAQSLLISVQKFRYDLVILDLSLTEHKLEIVRAVRKITPHTDVILLSESEDARLAIDAFRLGIRDYLLKPVNPETLHWAIENSMDASGNFGLDLQADLEIFRTCHQIRISDSEDAMRMLAMHTLVSVTNAQGGCWLWPHKSLDVAAQYTHGDCAIATKHIHQKNSATPRLFQKSFDILPTPQEWFHGEDIWIPLRAPWMGGMFLWQARGKPEGTSLSRIEYLVRNLEVALENAHRYLQAKRLTYLDDLTGLYNSRYLTIFLSALITQNERSGFAVLFIDIDKFKSVNDTKGHLVGSALLREMGNLLKHELRRPDALFRYGGDEFVAVLRTGHRIEAVGVAERLRSTVEKYRFQAQGHTLSITVSIGVASFPEDGQTHEQIIQMADAAMYKGKSSGRNSVFAASKT